MSVGPVLVSAGRMINKHCDENKQRCCGQADRINHHQAGKTAVVREYGIYPCNPGSADTDGCKQCRDKRNPETPEIAGHDLIEQTENVCGKDNDQTGITDVNNLGITVKQGEQEFSAGEDLQQLLPDLRLHITAELFCIAGSALRHNSVPRMLCRPG